MKEFKSYKEVAKYANKKDLELTVKKFNHKNRLFLFHGDHSIFSLTNFLVETVKFIFNGEKEIIYIVYTEHHGVFVYCASDLRRLAVTKYESEAKVLKEYKTTFLK